MSTFNDALPDSQQTMTCPFNPSHTVTKFKFRKHVLKCKKNHPEANLRVCKFNNYHYFPPGELLTAHQKVCPNRADVEKCVFAAGKRKAEVEDTMSEKKRCKLPVKEDPDSSDNEWDDKNIPSSSEALSIEERRKRVEEDPNKIVLFQHTTKSERNASRLLRQQKIKEAEERIKRDGKLEDYSEEGLLRSDYVD